jgi:hypothetical protein
MTLNASLVLFMVVRLLTDPNTRKQRIGSQLMALWKAWRKTG